MVRFKEAVKSFGDFKVIDNADLEIRDGEAFCFLGANGAGKSTMLRVIAGIYSLDSGKAEIDTEKIYNNEKVKKNVFFVNDEPGLFPDYTPKELMEYYSVFYEDFSKEKFISLCEKVSLPLNKKMKTFSKGMKRQVALISGVSANTKYLLLDEAFDGIDPVMKKIVKDMLIDSMLDRKTTLIMTSHNPKDAEEICSSVAFVYNGKIVFSSSLDDVSQIMHNVRFTLNGNKKLPDFDFVIKAERFEYFCSIVAKGDKVKIRNALLNYGAAHVDVVPMTLEELFIYKMEEAGYDAKLYVE